jgi:hypothetical protein
MSRIITFISSLVLVLCLVSCDYYQSDVYDDITFDDVDDMYEGNWNTEIANDTEETTLENDLPVQIESPMSSSDCASKHYSDVVEEFEEAGFVNIKTIAIYDLVMGWLTFDGEVETVTINGSSSFTLGERYDREVSIIIKYHTWASDEPQITMPNASYYYDEGWTLDSLEKHFYELGFENIQMEIVVDSGEFSKFHHFGEICCVGAGDSWLNNWSQGDIFGSSTPIIIEYYERTLTNTTENSPDLVMFMNRETEYSMFAEQYNDKFIEFDAKVVDLVYGITGKVELVHVSYGCDAELKNGQIVILDVELTSGKDEEIDTTVAIGDSVHVIAKVDDYYVGYYKSLYARAAVIAKQEAIS